MCGNYSQQEYHKHRGFFYHLDAGRRLYFIQDLFVARPETPYFSLWLLTVITAVGINELNREVIKVSNDERPVELNREARCIFRTEGRAGGRSIRSGWVGGGVSSYRKRY